METGLTGLNEVDIGGGDDPEAVGGHAGAAAGPTGC